MLLEPSDQWEPGRPTVNSNLFLSTLEMNETVQFLYLSPSAESYFSVFSLIQFLIIHKTKIRRKQTDDMMELNPIIVRLMMFTFLIFTVVVILLLSERDYKPRMRRISVFYNSGSV